MSPTYDPQQVSAAKERIAAAKQQRERDQAEAEHRFWQTVADEIAAGHCRQADAVEATGYTREYIRKQIKKLTDHS